MEIIYFLVPVGMVMLAIAVALFTWAVKSDQFEDLDREGTRILFDDDLLSPPAHPILDDTMSIKKTKPSETPPRGTKS